jgi:type IV secretory pathway protease TraF
VTLSRSTALVGAAVLVVVVSTHWWTFNITPSVPVGLYWRRAVPPTLARGDLVIFAVPASVQAFHSRWLPLLKPVAAVAGDLVCMDSALLWAASNWTERPAVAYGLVHQQVAGEDLPQLLGEGHCLTIEEGQVLLASKEPRSLDGRYFGLTPITDIRALALPLLTWR